MIGTFSHTRRLKERLTIQTETETDLGGGAVTVDSTAVASVRARVRPLKGREYIQARQNVGGTPYEVTIRAPLPAGAVLSSDSRLIWERQGEAVTLHLTSPPALTEEQRYYRFMTVEREE